MAITTYLLILLLVQRGQLNPIVFDQESKVHWSLKTNPIKYGEPVRLTCNVSCCKQKGGKVLQWYGRQDRNIFSCSNETCNPQGKYQVQTYDSTQSFDLIINNFAEDDLNVDYTCLCDFDKHTSSLGIQNATIIYEPKKEEVTFWSAVVNRSIQFNITVDKIKPVPVCYAVFTDKKYSIVGDINYKLNVTVVDITGNFSKVIITGTVHSDIKCKGTLTIDCCLMATEKSLLGQEMNFCQEQEVHTPRNVFYKTGPIVVFVLIICCVTVLWIGICLYKRDRIDAFISSFQLGDWLRSCTSTTTSSSDIRPTEHNKQQTQNLLKKT